MGVIGLCAEFGVESETVLCPVDCGRGGDFATIPLRHISQIMTLSQIMTRKEKTAAFEQQKRIIQKGPSYWASRFSFPANKDAITMSPASTERQMPGRNVLATDFEPELYC